MEGLCQSILDAGDAEIEERQLLGLEDFGRIEGIKRFHKLDIGTNR